MLGRAGRADHVRAAGLGDLHGEVADAAGRGVDQRPLAGAQVRRVDQRLPGRQGGQRDGAGRHVVHVGRLGGERARRADHVLGERAHAERVRQHAEHLVAGREQGHPQADRLDHAGGLPAQHERRIAEEPAGRPVLPVGGVQAGRVHPDEDLRGAGLRPVQLDDPQHLRPAQHVLPHRPHLRVLRHAPSLPAPTPTRKTPPTLRPTHRPAHAPPAPTPGTHPRPGAHAAHVGTPRTRHLAGRRHRRRPRSGSQAPTPPASDSAAARYAVGVQPASVRNSRFRCGWST